MGSNFCEFHVKCFVNINIEYFLLHFESFFYSEIRWYFKIKSIFMSYQVNKSILCSLGHRKTQWSGLTGKCLEALCCTIILFTHELCLINLFSTVNTLSFIKYTITFIYQSFFNISSITLFNISLITLWKISLDSPKKISSQRCIMLFSKE